jgi:hypothetical protein
MRYVSVRTAIAHKQFDNNAQGFAAFLVWLTTFGDFQPWICLEATVVYSLPLVERATVLA